MMIGGNIFDVVANVLSKDYLSALNSFIKVLDVKSPDIACESPGKYRG